MESETTLAHQDIKIFGYRIPHYFWFALSGGLCDIAQAFIDYGVSQVYVWEEYKPTVCWTVSYILSICIRHYSHKVLVFGDYEGTYCSSLTKTYVTYFSSIVISIVTNYSLTAYFFLTHFQAWITTMLWTGIFNYFMLKATWRSEDKSGSAR